MLALLFVLAVPFLWKTLISSDHDVDIPAAIAARGIRVIRRVSEDEAIAEFQKAMELSPGNPSSASNLAYAYAVSGQKDEAIRVLRTIPAMDPYFADAQRALAALAH